MCYIGCAFNISLSNLFYMFQSLFSFNGRIRRTEFGISFIIYMIIAVPLRFSESSMLLVAYIPLLWFLWSQGAKRCHDLGKSGFWQLIPFYVFWLLFENGQYGENEFGDNPKGESDPFINYGIKDDLFNPDNAGSFTTDQIDSFTAKPKD